MGYGAKIKHWGDNRDKISKRVLQKKCARRFLKGILQIYGGTDDWWRVHGSPPFGRAAERLNLGWLADFNLSPRLNNTYCRAE
jgi:hypothetical protein